MEVFEQNYCGKYAVRAFCWLAGKEDRFRLNRLCHLRESGSHDYNGEQGETHHGYILGATCSHFGVHRP